MIYANFKAIILKKNLAWQFDEQDDRYNLFAIDGEVRYDCAIFKANANVLGMDKEDEVASVADFEANYKAASNYAIGMRCYPFSTSDMQFAGKGFNDVAAAGQETDLWFELKDGYYLTGGEYWTIGAAPGDTLQVDIVDKDGHYAPAGTVLVNPPYMQEWQILPKDGVLIKFERTYAGKPPPRVFARFHYKSKGGTDVQFFANMYLHKPL